MTIDLERRFFLEVVDNGTGISTADLELVGERYCTSKHSVTAAITNDFKFYGFRGEALASCRDIGLLTITTRRIEDGLTLCKVMNSSKVLSLGPATIHRPDQGTTVRLDDIFGNYPVRRKRLQGRTELDSVRMKLATVALIHPEASISLMNDFTATRLMQTHRSQSVAHIYAQLFGEEKARVLGPVSRQSIPVTGALSSATSAAVGLRGYVAVTGHHNKTLQFLYINGRHVIKTRIHKMLATAFAQTSVCIVRESEEMFAHTSHLQPIHHMNKKPLCCLVRRSSIIVPDVYMAESPCINCNCPFLCEPLLWNRSYGASRYPAYVLDIRVPREWYDICLEPAKTYVEFRDWTLVERVINTACSEFISKNELSLGQELETATSSVNSTTTLRGYGGEDAAPAAARDSSSMQMIRPPDPLKNPPDLGPFVAALQRRDHIGSAIKSRAVRRIVQPYLLQSRQAVPSQTRKNENSDTDTDLQPPGAIEKMLPQTTKWRRGSEMNVSNTTLSDDLIGSVASAGSTATLVAEWNAARWVAPENVVSRVARPTVAAAPSKLDKAIFERLEVLNQVDRKFIACVQRPGPGAQFAEAEKLVMVDQHAAHERVLYERLESDIYCESLLGIRQIRSIDARPLAVLILTSAEHRLFERFRTEMRCWGLECAAKPDWIDTEKADQVRLRLIKIPAVLSKSPAAIIEAFVREQLDLILHTTGALTNAVPRIITYVLKSRACRGAIKFGDLLTRKQCIELMDALGKCQLPFQCAHGRPSCVPIIEL